MELKTFFAQDLQGNVIANPTVYVYQPSTTTLATGLQDENGVARTNPFNGTANGKVTVAAPDGDYDIRVTGAGRDTTMRVRFIDSVAGSADILRNDLASTAAGKGAVLVAFKQAGTGAVATNVQSKLRERASVKDFGAVGDGVTNDTVAVQNALDYVKATGITLEFEPKKTYLVSQVSIVTAGGNTRSNFRIEGNGALLQGSTSSTTFRAFRCQGLNIHGLRVAKHASAAYATELDSMWFANFTECEFGETNLHSGNNWGLYWNEFNGCSFSSLRFDLADYSINQNVWKGCQVGVITKTNAGHPSFKEAYNNVFIGCDMLGAIDWRDPSSSFRDPIVLRDCNMEYTGINYGYIIATGGRSNPVNATITRLFPEDDLRSEFNQQYSGGSWVTGWYPWNSTNLFRGGACQRFSPDIGTVAVAASFLSIFADATSPTGNGYCYRLNVAGSSSARIRLTMPSEYLEQAIKVGFVTFCLWVYNVNGAAFIASTTSAAPPTGDAYPTGTSFPTNQWIQRFVTIPVPPGSTAVNLYIGGNTVTNFDVRVADISINLGKIARPYSPAPGEPHPRRACVVSKTLVANGTAQNTFSFPVTDGTAGRMKIRALQSNADSVSIYEGQLTYARQNNITVANVVQISKAQSGGYSGGTPGTIDAMAASASGGTITVTTTIATYSGAPNRTVIYEIEFLDRNETVTVL